MSCITTCSVNTPVGDLTLVPGGPESGAESGAETTISNAGLRTELARGGAPSGAGLLYGHLLTLTMGAALAARHRFAVSLALARLLAGDDSAALMTFRCAPIAATY